MVGDWDIYDLGIAHWWRQEPNSTIEKCSRQGPNNYKHVTPPGSGHCLKLTPEGSHVSRILAARGVMDQ